MLAGGVNKPTPFMASIDYDPELLTPFMAQQQRDYLAELLQRLKA